jgi:hypothetical protein
VWLGVKKALSDPEPGPWSRSTSSSLNLSLIRRPFVHHRAALGTIEATYRGSEFASDGDPCDGVGFGLWRPAAIDHAPSPPRAQLAGSVGFEASSAFSLPGRSS